MDYSAALLDENRAFGELVRGADPELPIPACPDWNLKQLFRHVGRGHLWTAQIVAERLDYRPDPRTVEGGKPPDDSDDAITWLHDGAQRVIDAVAQTGADTPVWTFLGPRPAAWWIRRRLHELTVHRADAALAMGLRYDLAPELAADGISEWFDLIAPRAGRDDPPALSDGQSMHLHATDPGLGSAGEWTVSARPSGITWSHDHGKATVALRGGATELLLATLRRVPLTDTGITAFGDTAVWQSWLDHTPY